MSARSNLLFVCDDPEASARFGKSLRDAGFRLLLMRRTDRTIMLTSDGPVDGVLVYEDDLQIGSAIGSRLKNLLGNTPVVLISTECETIASWLGIDAVCYTNSLDDEMARIIAMLFRDLLIQQPHPANVRIERRDLPLRPFVV